MAVMGRKKQMIANIIRGREIRVNKAIQDQREKEKGKEISEEEHQKRLNLLKEIGVADEQSMGAELEKDDVNQILSLAWAANALYKTRKSHEDYLTKNMETLFANLTAITGHLLGAKLIAHAGSAERLVKMPASTIQMLGAEKALFRHMKTGAKPPRHGIIVHHPLIAKAPDRMHGKIARTLADKIAIASKVDYFQGQFIGDKLKKELEDKDFIDDRKFGIMDKEIEKALKNFKL